MRGIPSGAKKYWLELLITPSVSLLGVGAAALAIYFTVRSNDRTDRAQSTTALRSERAAELAAFRLAAAQIVMAQPTCKLAEARAARLTAYFPDRLNSSDFRRLARYSADVCKQIAAHPVTYTFPQGFTGIVAPNGKPYTLPPGSKFQLIVPASGKGATYYVPAPQSKRKSG